MRTLYHKVTNGFNAIFISKPAYKGEVIYTLSDKEKSGEKTRTSIHIGNDFHVEDDLGRYINHSCNPTCKICGVNVILIKNV